MYKQNSIIFLLYFGFFYSLSVTATEECASASFPAVALTTGCVEGTSQTTALGRLYYSFQGIPYAAPPVGDLRFKAPRQPANWTGVLRAVQEPPACLQPWRENGFPITFSEDCLYLNVYTPNISQPLDKLLPVIVWIHGGKFYQGSGTIYKYGPDFLLSKDVVIVSVNYRLGVFGFLNMDIPGAQGNAGLKDLVAALRWVQREISKFGGDPNLVTISGGSSGAGSVNLLYISPMAKGLFHRAISHSGAAACFSDFSTSSAFLGLRLAQALGCPTSTPQAVVFCLRTMNGTDLAEKQMILNGVNGLDNPFTPALERDHGEEVFLPDNLETLLANNRTSDAPYIFGLMNGEGLMYVDNPKSNPDQFTSLENNLITYLPPHILTTEDPNILIYVTERIKDFYLGDSLNDTMYGFVNFMTDREFGYCELKTVQVISTRAPVYLFYFTFEGEFQRKDHNHQALNLTGVCHGEELGYLFFRNYAITAQNNLTAYPRDMAMVEKMVGFWTNFAEYGNPTPQPNEFNISWMPAQGVWTNHLVIGDSLEVVPQPLLEERVAFWDGLYNFLSMKHALNPVARHTYGSYKTAGFLLLIVVNLGVVYVVISNRWRKYSSYERL